MQICAPFSRVPLLLTCGHTRCGAGTQGWPHDGRQQDAADFLGHFLQAGPLVHFQGSWAVLAQGQLLDCGTVCMPTPPPQCHLSAQLPTVRGVCNLQQLVRHWHDIPAKPALTAGVACAALQLNRFCTAGRVVRKDVPPVSLPRFSR